MTSTFASKQDRTLSGIIYRGLGPLQMAAAEPEAEKVNSDDVKEATDERLYSVRISRVTGIEWGTDLSFSWVYVRDLQPGGVADTCGEISKGDQVEHSVFMYRRVCIVIRRVLHLPYKWLSCPPSGMFLKRLHLLNIYARVRFGVSLLTPIQGHHHRKTHDRLHHTSRKIVTLLYFIRHKLWVRAPLAFPAYCT